MKEKRYTVYVHRNKENGKVYVGMTGMEPEERWRKGRGYRSTRHFFSAIKKYGWDSFAHEIIATGLSREEAAQLEIKLICKYDSTNPEKGYNVSTGGKCGRAGVPLSPEAIESIKRKNANRVISEETRQKMRIARARIESSGMKGKHHTEETRKHLSEIGKTKTGTLNSFYGRKHSDKAKQKMHDAKIGRTLTQEHIEKVSNALSHPVAQYDLSGNLIQEYKSTVEASLEFSGKKVSHISEVCNGKRKMAYGYVWKYVGVV